MKHAALRREDRRPVRHLGAKGAPASGWSGAGGANPHTRGLGGTWHDVSLPRAHPTAAQAGRGNRFRWADIAEPALCVDT